MNGNLIIPKWIVGILITLLLGGWGAFGKLSFQANSALPRVEAYETFVKQEDYEKDMVTLQKQLSAIAQDVKETREAVIRMEVRQ